MSDKDDELWSEVGAALRPRRSEAQWTALRARVMSRVKGSARAQLRPWVAASALAALGFGLVLISRLTREPETIEIADVAWDTRIVAAEGLVTVIPSGQTDPVPASAGLPVQAGDLLQVGPESRAELGFADKGVVCVGPSSVLKLAKLDEAQSFLELSVGSLVAKLDWHGDGKTHRLAVRTPAVVAAVRGTEFGVVVGDDGATSVGVFDQGRVSVTDNDASSVQETMLTANQEVRVSRGAAPDTELRDGRYFLRAGALQDLQAYRPVLDEVRSREQAVRRDWRPLASGEREQERASRFGASADRGGAPGLQQPRPSGPNASPEGRPQNGDARAPRAQDERRGPESEERRGPENGRPEREGDRARPDEEPRANRGDPPRGPARGGPRGPGGDRQGEEGEGRGRQDSREGARRRPNESGSPDSNGGPQGPGGGPQGPGGPPRR